MKANHLSCILSSLEQKAHDDSIPVEPASVCVCVCLSVCVFTFSNMNISETSGPIATKFYLKHHWVGGKNALGFGPDWIRTLVRLHF